jgi:hypothetical protein
VIGIEEDWLSGLLAQSSDYGGNFADTEEIALALGRSNQHRHVQCARDGRHRLQRDNIRHVEVADRNPSALGICLKTLEEIAIRYASLYRSHGGGELCYVPALNDSPGHNKALASLLRRHFGTGRPVRLIS